MPKTPKNVPAKNSRKLKTPRYKSFKLSKPIKHERGKLPSVWGLGRRTVRLLGSQKKIFIGLVIVYAVLTAVMVGSFGSSGGVNSIKQELQDVTGQTGELTTGFNAFYYLLSSGNTPSSESGGVYQFMLIIIFSLATIWVLRQVQAGKRVGVKQSFYSSMFPLIPFLLVLAVIVLQLLPLLIGNFLYTLVVNGGIATEVAEKVIWGLLAVLFALLSLYMLSSSIMALYIVTLPDMRPMQALRSARELVRHRRFLVMRKILALPVLLLILLGIVVVPLIIVAAPVAETVFFVLSSTMLLIAHTYLYTLYRELL